jgi:O-antigen/teichoic acid export membrane protein
MWDWLFSLRQTKTLVISTSHVFSAKVLSSVFSILIFLFLARIFTVEELGVFSFFTSVAVMLTVASNWGVNEYILREGAAAPGRLGDLVRNSMFIKGSLGLAFGFLTFSYLLFKETALLNILIFLLILLFALVDSQTITFIAAFRSQGITRFEAWFFPGRNACRLLTIVLISFWSKGLLEIICGMVLVNLTGFLVANRSFKRFRQEGQRGKISLRRAFEVARSATPFVLLAVIGMAYARADQIMLGLMKDSREVGIYALAWQVYETATFLPISIGIVLLPKLTRIYHDDAYRWIESGAKALGYTLLLGSVIGVSLFIALPYVIRYLFSAKYLASEPVIRVLMVAYIFNFVWVSLFISMLISGGNFQTLNLIVISSLALNIGANLYAIPRYGPLGAAYAAILSEVFTFAAGTWWLLKKMSDMKLAPVKT